MQTKNKKKHLMRLKNQLTMTRINSLTLIKSNMKGVVFDNSSLQPIAMIWVVEANFIISPCAFKVRVDRFSAKMT